MTTKSLLRMLLSGMSNRIGGCLNYLKKMKQTLVKAIFEIYGEREALLLICVERFLLRNL